MKTKVFISQPMNNKTDSKTLNQNWMRYLKFRKKVKTFEQNNNVK